MNISQDSGMLSSESRLYDIFHCGFNFIGHNRIPIPVFALTYVQVLNTSDEMRVIFMACVSCGP